jgi:nucleoid DNA-binding protein
MRQRQNLALGILLGTLGVIFGLSAPAQTTRARKDMSIPERIADATRLPEQDVNKFLNAIGPAIREDLRQGKEVSLPGLGTFRVVRVAEHKDLVNGRPAVIPATNTVEFIPEDTVTDAANTPGARPADTVPAFRYIPLPTQTPSQKAPYVRSPGMRTR